VAKRLRENPQLLESVVDIYIGAQIGRLLSIRNITGMGGAYGGPQLTLYQKMFGAKFIADMANVLGPYSFIDEDKLNGYWMMDILKLGNAVEFALLPVVPRRQ